jgi:hypothetical protein
MKYAVAQFIPIVLLFLLLAHARSLARFSHTILGKVAAVLIILFYTYVDVLAGVLACAIVLLYYQTDFVENMLNMEADELMDTHEILDDYYIETKTKTGDGKEDMVDYVREDPTIDTSLVMDTFRAEHCENGVLKHKGMRVKTDMAQHIFPELKFGTGTDCDPCAKSCIFSVIESKLKTEEAVVRGHGP